MDERAPSTPALGWYDAALPHVYGYLLRRCGSVEVAEDLTSEVFLAAVRGTGPRDPAWLVAIARHKLVDFWRRAERESRALVLLEGGAHEEVEEAWDVRLDASAARSVLRVLAPQHAAALTLRYLDGLAVVEVAHLLGRTVGATEVLLVRARRAFRAEYEARFGEEGR